MRWGRWGVVGVVWLLGCSQPESREEAPQQPPPPAVEAPALPPASVEEPPPPAPPASTSVMDEVVQSDGACGRSERVHLSPQELGGLLAASPHAKLLVLANGRPYGHTVLHPASGRTTSAYGTAVAYSTDERRVLLWDQQYPDALGYVREVDAVAGTQRELLGTRVRQPWVAVSADHVWLHAEDGAAYRYSLEDGSVLQVTGPSGNTTWSGTAAGYPERTLLPEGEGFVVWDDTTRQRWRVDQAEGAQLLEDGSGAVYVDAEGVAWGWTPEHPPVQLGVFGTVHDHRIWLGQRMPNAAGELVFRGPGEPGVVWKPSAGTVAPLPRDFWAPREPAGTRLLVNRSLPEGGQALAILDPADGSERVLLRTAGRAWGVWGAQGRELAVVEHASADPDSSQFVVRLFRSSDGEEVPLTPPVAGSDYEEGPSIDFVDGGRLLQVYVTGLESLYAVADGSLRFSTSRTSVPAEGHYSSWGPDGVFYGQVGAYMGPPDQGLFAWDPRTEVETQLGRGTQSVCFLGERLLFQHDLTPRMYSPGPLSAWTSATGERQLISSDAYLPSCTASPAGVLFLENLREEGGPRTGELVFASPERGCRQTLAKEVEAFWPGQDFVLLYDSKGVWRASYPSQ